MRRGGVGLYRLVERQLQLVAAGADVDAHHGQRRVAGRGFGLHRNVALVVANVDAVKAQTGATGDGEALLSDPKVVDLFKGELAKFGEKFKGFESVQDFALIDKDFTTENGMLTPSLKLKRRAVLEKYGPTIDELYKKKKAEKKAPSASA